MSTDNGGGLKNKVDIKSVYKLPDSMTYEVTKSSADTKEEDKKKKVGLHEPPVVKRLDFDKTEMKMSNLSVGDDISSPLRESRNRVEDVTMINPKKSTKKRPRRIRSRSKSPVPSKQSPIAAENGGGENTSDHHSIPSHSLTTAELVSIDVSLIKTKQCKEG